MPDTVAHLHKVETPERENQSSPVNSGLLEDLQTFFYRDDLDYLEDIRLLLIEQSKAKPGMAGCQFETPDIREIKNQINQRLERTRKNGVELRIDKVVELYGIKRLEKLIVCALAIRKITNDHYPFNGSNLLTAIAEEEIRDRKSVV